MFFSKFGIDIILWSSISISWELQEGAQTKHVMTVPSMNTLLISSRLSGLRSSDNSFQGTLLGCKQHRLEVSSSQNMTCPSQYVQCKSRAIVHLHLCR